MRRYSHERRKAGKTIALVPTMGFLHQGHLALMEKGRQLADHVVVSIFVNPTQFGPQEDLAAYPRDEKRDLELTEKIGVDAVFIPDVPQVYPDGFQTTISLKALPKHLCGLSRPGHFEGVATVVAKLLGIVRPHMAIFGEKDYQQLLVVRQMARDLEMDVEIIGAPIVRESDGLAMSSRNMYLADSQRKAAGSLYKALQTADRAVKQGETRTDVIIERAAAVIGAHREAAIDYIAVCDPATLDAVQVVNGPVRMALAVKVGEARLIDNMELKP
jgi:pantoate--beta-alanine ligase